MAEITDAAVEAVREAVEREMRSALIEVDPEMEGGDRG